MTISIVGRKIKLKDSFKDLAEKKIKKIEKFFGDDAEIRLTASDGKNYQRVEITIRNGSMIYRSERDAETMEEALDWVIDDIIRKIRKNKTRVEKQLKTGWTEELPKEPVEEEPEFKIVKYKKFDIKPMTPEEAILQMNLLGHRFYMFRNQETEDINAVYVRGDGNYGLIEPIG